MCGHFLEESSGSFLISCSNVDSLPFRSAVQLQPWAFFPLDFWVSATIVFHISCSPLAFYSITTLSSSWNKRFIIWVLAYLKLSFIWLVVSLCRILNKKYFSQNCETWFHHLLESGVADVIECPSVSVCGAAVPGNSGSFLFILMFLIFHKEQSDNSRRLGLT